MDAPMFQSVDFIPDSTPGEEGHYQGFADLYHRVTTEEHRPSIKPVKKKLPFSPSAQHANASTGQRYFIVIVYAASGSPLGSRVFSSRRPPSCFPLVDCCWACVSLKDSCIEACVCLPH